MSTEEKSSESKQKGLGRIFRRSKAEAGEGGAVRKAKSFKRIRGFLTGESRKQRRARKAEERKARNETPASRPEPGDDESTIYGVDVDERSIATAGAAGSSRTKVLGGGADEVTDDNLFAGTGGTKPYMLKVVLLLMDPETRRFELLQLEFDSKKALVSDVLAQIPVAVTEDALRKQNYTGICGKEGKEMAPQELLATFCSGNDVLVAIPQGVPAKECARLARPILSDEKVVNMLLSSGIDAKSWREQSKKKKKKSASIKSKAPPETTKEKKPPKLFSFVLIVLLAILLQVFHMYISAPIKPGHTVSPGIWLSKCGLLAFWPDCENAYMKVDNEGKVLLYNADKELAVEIQGDVCNEDDEECIPGLHVKEDGNLEIGGKEISWVSMYKESELSPWPFTVKPKVKVWKK